ncbi:DMT family transporter [Pseudoalteromonas sp.]|uniref:DMT family transporter n=1 Tax=Pseudoalteromonas sp. TaxID=53249 RepID=UPI00356A7045
MQKISLGLGMTLLVVGNIIAVFSDAIIKTLPADSPTFQFVFMRQLTAVLILIPFCISRGKTQLFVGLKWHAVRAHVWLFGIVFMVFALQALPLATANAIFYAAPLLMLPLAVMIFGEKLSVPSVAVAVIGFIGVLIVIQPSDINWAAIFAFVVAITLAINNVLIRKLPTHHTILQTLLLTNLVGMPMGLALALWENAPWHWAALVTALASTVFILIYAGICVYVYTRVAANQVASAEYSGLVAAVALGMLWFNEVPTLSLIVGASLIILPLVWLAKLQKNNQRLAKRQFAEAKSIEP